MKILRALTATLLCILLPASPVLSQQPAQDAEVVIMPEGKAVLQWFAHAGRTYFIQSSDSNDHLGTWVWSDLIESATNRSISHEVGSTADKAFFRLHYTDAPPPPGVSLEDWDADGDGLPNALELQLQSNPLNADTSGDGIPDGWAYAHGLHPAADNASGLFQGGAASNLEAYQQGVQANPAATIDDYDGDGVNNEDDADPQDADVDWQRANTSSYVLIEIDVPSGPGHIRDFNDAGHVLFDAGVWNSGVWNAFSQVETSGTVNHQEIELNYEATGNFGWRLSPQGSVLEQGSFAVYGPGDLEGVGHVVRRAYSLGSNSYGSPVTTLHALEWASQSEQIISLEPLGEDAANRVFSYREFHPFNPDYPASQIWILNSNLIQTGSYQVPAGYRVFNHGNQVTPAGWLAVNASPHTGNAPAARTIVWNPSGQEITAPGGLPWYFSGLTQLPHGKPALACRYHGSNGLVYLLNQNGDAFKTAEKLGGKRIHTFAGDGTAMTSDGKMWINGELLPLRDLCPAYGDLLDDGWFFHIHKANKHGAYLLESHKDEESRHNILFPVEVRYVDRDVMSNQWAQKKPYYPTSSAIYAGPHSGDMIEWRITGDVFDSQSICWEAKHIESGEIIPGPSGIGVNFWRIANVEGNAPMEDEWLKWKPGEYGIFCEIAGFRTELQKITVGYRSDHVLVIGQIVPTFTHDPDKPSGGGGGLWAAAVADDFVSSFLPTAAPRAFHDDLALGIGATFLLLPERGAEAWAASWAGALGFPPGLIPGWFPSGWIPPPIAPISLPPASIGPAVASFGGIHGSVGTMTANQHYWATQHMLNMNPDTPDAPALIYTKSSETPPGEVAFVKVFNDRQYRICHEFQAKFLLDENGQIDPDPATFKALHNRATKGTTKLKIGEINAGDWGTIYNSMGIGLPPLATPIPPFDIKPFPDEPSEKNEHNETISHDSSGKEISSFATARIGEDGRRVSYRQFGKDAPWIFSEIIFAVDDDWEVNLLGRTSTTVQWNLVVDADNTETITVSRSTYAPTSTPGISIFNNLNLYSRSEIDRFVRLNGGLLSMEGHLQSFVESGSGAWPEPAIPPTVK